jgi:putative tricarboxylic transport membrane protein
MLALAQRATTDFFKTSRRFEMAKVNRLFSGVMILLALAFYFMSNSLSEDAAKWPQFFTILLIILSIGLIVDTVIKPNREQVEKEEKEVKPVKDRSVLYTIIITFAYLLLMNFIGFLLLTPIYVFVLLWVINYRNTTRLIALSISTTIVITVIFQFLLNVPIPQGILDNLF